MKYRILLPLGIAFALPLLPAITYAGGQGKHKQSPQDVFKAKDNDRDELLSREEFVDGAKDPAKAAAAFVKKDINGDGKLSLAEFIANDGKDEAQLEADKEAKAKAKAKADAQVRAQQRIIIDERTRAQLRAKAEQKAKAEAKAKADKWHKK